MRTFLALFAFAGLLSGCGGGGGDGPAPAADLKAPLSKLALKSFSGGCGDFLDYAADALTEQYLQSFTCLGFGPCPVFAGAPSTDDDLNAPTAGAVESSEPDRVSSTNTQESDVDEADIVKVDAAGRLYILSGRSLHILPAFPPAGLETRPLSSLEIAAGDNGFYASDFFLDETNARLVVLGNSYNASPFSRNIVVDISNPAEPSVIGSVSLSGFGLEARRVGNRVHRVSRFDVPAPDWFGNNSDALAQRRQDYRNALDRGDQSAADGIKTEIRTVIGQRVTAAGAESLLPRVAVQGGGESALPCTSIFFPGVTAGLGLALIDSFNTDGSQRAVSGVVNNAHIVYASSQNLYLAQSSFGWFFAPQQAEQTAIYKLALSPTGAVSYQGVGTVDGSILGSYAMSEYAGDLRVASTQSRFAGNVAENLNHVSILRGTDAGALTQVGALRDLAPGERIQGVRFVGDKGYVVTFRNIDPLFALDLSNPQQPRVTDELKIPGFSSYLLPLGGTHLLTIGRAGNEEQLNGQVAIQLFDVGDSANIVQVASVSPALAGSGGSYSAAEYDPHAFAYFADSDAAALPGTLSVPLHSYDHVSGNGFSGFLVMRVDPAAVPALRELGRISHAEFSQPGNDCRGGGPASSFAPCRDAYYAADPRRSVFMQDAQGTYLFTVSALGVMASDASAPSTTLGRKTLPFDEPPCCFVSDAAVSAAP